MDATNYGVHLPVTSRHFLSITGLVLFLLIQLQVGHCDNSVSDLTGIESEFINGDISKYERRKRDVEHDIEGTKIENFDVIDTKDIVISTQPKEDINADNLKEIAESKTFTEESGIRTLKVIETGENLPDNKKDAVAATESSNNETDLATLAYNSSDISPGRAVVLNEGDVGEGNETSIDKTSTTSSTTTTTTITSKITTTTTTATTTTTEILPDFPDKIAVVPKCCPVGQNFSDSIIDGGHPCWESELVFKPLFFDFNGTYMWEYENNEWQTLVGNPCLYGKYMLDPQDSKDEFYLLINGSLLAPFHSPQLLGPKQFCMETFWSNGSSAEVILPLVCFASPPIDQGGAHVPYVAYAAGLLTSVPFLVMTALVYLLIPELRNNHGMALACHCICLAIAFICLASTQLVGQVLPETECMILAFLIQFTFIASFCWLNVMCYDTWLIITHYLPKDDTLKRRRIRFMRYSAYAWTVSLIMLAVTMAMDLHPTVPSSFTKPNFAKTGCWFQSDEAAFPYFYGPVGAILLVNVVLFVMTSRSLAKHKEYMTITQADITLVNCGPRIANWDRFDNTPGTENPAEDFTLCSSPEMSRTSQLKKRWKKYRKLFWMLCLLCIVMGLSWIFDVISWIVGGAPVVWSIVDAINALQGLIIFIIFVCQKTVRDIVWKTIREKFEKGCWGTRQETKINSVRPIISSVDSDNETRKWVYN